MITENIVINIPDNFDTRPLALIVQIASQFESSIYIAYDEKKVNAKSIMGMMTLALGKKEEFVITADGSDETQAMDAILEYFKQLNHPKDK